MGEPEVIGWCLLVIIGTTAAWNYLVSATHYPLPRLNPSPRIGPILVLCALLLLCLSIVGNVLFDAPPG